MTNETDNRGTEQETKEQKAQRIENQAQRVLLIEDAQEHLVKAIDLLEEAFPKDGMVQAYVIDHLKILTSRDLAHGYLTSDTNLDDLIEQTEDGEYDDEPCPWDGEPRNDMAEDDDDEAEIRNDEC